jgi:glycosyltransferase involved in cell wall biosynthesis
MRIMKVISSLQFGGAETQAINLSKALVNQGHQVLLVSLSKNVPRIAELEGTQVEFKVENKKYKVDFSVVSGLRKCIKKWQPDIIHGYLYDAEFYSRAAALGLKTPVINSERNDNYQLNTNQKIGDFLTIGLADGVIANTYAGKSFAAARYRHLAENKLHVVWNGIDINRINQKKLACNVNYREQLFNTNTIKLACMVASIKPQKDYILALEVAKNLIQSSDEWRIVFLGDKVTEKTNKYKAKVENYFNNMDEKVKIKFLGNRADVIEILSQSDVSFLTSHHEGFPNAVLESMAVGTPVITTEFSDINKISPRNWMTITSRDPLDISNAVNKALLERNLLSEESIEWVDKNCSIDIIAQKLSAVYESHIQPING